MNVDDLLLAGSTEEELDEPSAECVEDQGEGKSDRVCLGACRVSYSSRVARSCESEKGTASCFSVLGATTVHELAVEYVERAGEQLKPWTSKVMPNFEGIVKIFADEQVRFRNVLRMLA